MITTELVKDWLLNEGYKFEVDEDGDIRFKYQGKAFYCTGDSNDEQFFRIIMPGIYQLEDNRVKVLEAINTVCREMKVLKAFLVDDKLWLSIEMFVDSSPEVDDFIERCLNILTAGFERIAHEIFSEE